MSKYLYILTISLRDAVFYKSKLVSYVVLWFFRVFILLFIYSYAYEYAGEHIHGISLPVAIWSIAVYFFMLSFNIRGIYRDISEEVKLGTIENKLNKPFNYLFYTMASRLGKGIPDFMFCFVAAVPLLSYLVGFPAQQVTPFWFLQIIILTMGGIAIGCLLYSLVGLTAVWLQDADPIYWITDKAVLILGGSYIPVALFPDVVQTMAESTPFGAAMFVTQIFNPDFSDKWLYLVLVQVVWFIVLALCTMLIYSRANKKLSINGG